MTETTQTEKTTSSDATLYDAISRLSPRTLNILAALFGVESPEETAQAAADDERLDAIAREFPDTLYLKDS